METPLFPMKIFSKYFENVYEPSEDTFLLLDAIEQDLNQIRNLKPVICLEIGCGSGAVSTSLAKALGPFNLAYFAIDINQKALECTRRCCEVNINNTLDDQTFYFNLVRSDLASALNLNNLVDLLIFNPPYVPTPEEEIDNGIEASWAGGNFGRTVIDRFLTNTLPEVLSQIGLAYLVIIEQNNFNEIKTLVKHLGFDCHSVITRKCGIEKLSVLRFNRKL